MYQFVVVSVAKLRVIEWMICGPFHQYSLGMRWKKFFFSHSSYSTTAKAEVGRSTTLAMSWYLCIVLGFVDTYIWRAWWDVQWPLTFKQFTTIRKQKHVGSKKIRNTLILKKTSFITKQNFMFSKTIIKPLCQNVKEKCEICYYM